MVMFISIKNLTDMWKEYQKENMGVKCDAMI